MKTVKKIILLFVPTSICNLRCHYCYLAQGKNAYQGLQPKMQYTPDQVAAGLSASRLGGPCFINVCAEGETLLTKDIDLYLKKLAQEGHYIEIVTNLTVTPMIDRILSWDVSLLKHIEFKCSFHYMELKKRNLLSTFSTNARKIWKAGASASIELTPSDELIPFIDEVKSFSMREFGALPQLTIARDDRTSNIERLTKLPLSEYEKTWSVFHSNFWDYKQQIFGIKQKSFCYAGMWSITVNLANGYARKCYFDPIGNIFDNPNAPLTLSPIGKCPIAHCYNGHAFMTLGLIPNKTDIRYGDIRNRTRADGTEWLQPELRDFFNSTLVQSNRELNLGEKVACRTLNSFNSFRRSLVDYRFYKKLHDWKSKLK